MHGAAGEAARDHRTLPPGCVEREVAAMNEDEPGEGERQHDGVTTIEAFAATIEEPRINRRTVTHRRRVEEIFDAALDVAPGERSAFLARACAGNDELQREVEDLLAVEREQTLGLLPSGELAMISALADLHPSLKGLSLAPGMQLGRYRLLRSLGQGGMGTVFLAHDRRLHRRVAIKFLHAATEEMTERFLAEARNTARCKHENIVVLHDVDEIDGHPYMVLECLDGEPLRQRLAGLVGTGASTTREGPHRQVEATTTAVPVTEVLELVIPVVRALVCAHAQGIVHRDLKPENVFLCGNGTVKVLDFGIAKAMTDIIHSSISLATSASLLELEERIVTEQGALLGTLPYMSPEQWGTDEIDERTDLWAVGIMLYEMLAGEHPLAPLSYSKMQQLVPKLNLPMPSIGAALPGLGTLADIVDGCLRKHKVERIRSAEALLQALEAARVELSPATTEAARTSTPTAPQASQTSQGSGEDPDTGERREPVRAASTGDASRPREAHAPSPSWLAATASWLATLALLAFWPRFAIPAFPDPSGGIVLALSARADDALRLAQRALCASMRADDAEGVRCIELPRIGVGGRELRDAAAAAGASLVVWLDEDHGLRLVPVSTHADLLSELPTLHVGIVKRERHLAGILRSLSRVLAGDARIDVSRVPPLSPDTVDWRLAALTWYLNVLASNQQAIPRAALRRTMTRCHDEVSLAEASCGLVHYVHTQLDPTPPDARYWLEELLIHGPPSFADQIAIELASDDCMHEPARAQAALLRLAVRWADAPCRRLMLVGPARCLLSRYPQASAALQPVANPGDDIEMRCEAELAAATPAHATIEPAPPISVEVTSEPAPISVEVTSEPAGARVFVSDRSEPLGVTPYVYEAPSRAGRVSLRLELAGYEAAEVWFPGDRDGVARQVLQKTPTRLGPDDPRPGRSSAGDLFHHR
jgi:serine/threonine protein kinase